MELNDYLYKETIECIPSDDLRAHMLSNPMDLSILQKATIIDYFADKKAKINLFRQLAEATTSKDEKELLLCAVSEIKKLGYVDSATQEIYERKFPHIGAPFFPFLERCYLPELFRGDDIVKYNNQYYQVQALPYLNEHCDFSDECYLCFPVDRQGHLHIHLGEAERPTKEERLEAMDMLLHKMPR